MSSKKITWKTIKKNKFLVLNNKVYDTKNFIDRHPGGSSIIQQWLGKDATEAFNNVYHSERAKEMLKDLYIGDLDVNSDYNEENITIRQMGFIFLLTIVTGILLYFIIY